MNNKIVSTKTTSAIFLAIVLITGTITLSFLSSSFIIAYAQAQPYSDGMDYNNYKTSKDNSKSNTISINKIRDKYKQEVH